MDKTPPDRARAFHTHDHAGCIDAAMSSAREECARRGLRLTEIRARVLEILLESHHALGAYDVLERLSAEGRGMQPPVAYRALDFLTSHGFAHRIERLNAFVACAHPGQGHDPAFLICTGCGRIGETRAAPVAPALDAVAEETGFHIQSAVVELEGLCPACREAE